MEEKMLYNILDVKYLKMFNRKITYDSNANSDLYPNGWYLNKDYKVKIKILIEAIENKKLIVDTDLYQNIIEGVRKKH